MTGEPNRKDGNDNYLPPEENAFDPTVKAYDLDALQWSTAEEIRESLATVNRAMLARQITPAQSKAAAAVAAQSLKAIGLSVSKQIRELKEQFDAREREGRGAGRRKGI
jgi:hypothetical protein